VRPVRMLSICLAALCVAIAVTAAPAFAKKEVNIYEKFNECPFGYPPLGAEFQGLTSCVYGEAGKESFFQAGKTTIDFKKPVILSVGAEENLNTGETSVIPGRYGNSISKEAEPAPSLTEGIDVEKLEEPEKKRYEEYIAKGGSTKVTATTELAAPGTDITINEASFVEEYSEGAGPPAFSFPVEIHISNKFLGTHCYVGNYTEPIVINFYAGETKPTGPNTPIRGYKGRIVVTGEGGILELENAKLVNNTYASPGVEGCGIQGGADAALDAGLGLPSPSGSNTTELLGNLYLAGWEEVERHIKPY
jgi:hypothetical protein